jgi:hypothetical protein
MKQVSSSFRARVSKFRQEQMQETKRERETHDVADDCDSSGGSHGRASGGVGFGRSGGRGTGETAESGHVHQRA